MCAGGCFSASPQLVCNGPNKGIVEVPATHLIAESDDASDSIN